MERMRVAEQDDIAAQAGASQQGQSGGQPFPVANMKWRWGAQVRSHSAAYCYKIKQCNLT
jgi:hypothetical protein